MINVPIHVCLLLLLLPWVVLAHGHDDPSSEESGAECEASQMEEYSMGWHIGAVFIVMLSSAIGTFSTLSLGVMSEQPIFIRTLQIFKMFGIGVIAATAWCHLIPDAFESFTSECLPEGWAEYGSGFVGVFALASSFIVQSIELSAGGGHSYSHGVPSPLALHPEQAAPNGPVHDSSAFRPETDAHERSRTMATAILEAGILFHSIIIGVSLGVTGDSDTFKTLLIAVCFHQFFEGLALGAMISKLNRSRLCKFLGMGLMYPITTPVGIVIGIAVRASFNANATGTIVTEGILNSASAGILLYNTYSELLATEVNHNETFKHFSPSYKVCNMLSLYLGAAAMAILAYWA